MTDALPPFAEVFEALWGYKPFPWQARLVDEVLANGWPDLLDLPTGTGKTSTLDVALYCLAADPLRMPRRTVLVVDRRVVVDQGAQRARSILARMSAGDSSAVRALADRLRASWDADTSADPFSVAVMRGGVPRDNDWARRPDQPVLGVSTIDQLGSRLLFRGYGVSPRALPVHAGLLGNDTLILLDEVHLAVPFMKTLTAMRKCYMRGIEALPERFAFVRMSATVGERDPNWRVFQLDDADRGHSALAARLRAAKPARLVPLRVSGDDAAKKRELLANKLVAEAHALQAQGASVIGIVVNRVDTARLVYRNLQRESQALQDEGAPNAILVTGRMRPVDRDRVVRTQLLPRAAAREKRPAVAAPFFVVATQCIEAGADLDFDALVTECASLDALRQRFGRLDRQGTLGRARAVIVGPSDAVAAGSEDPVYGSALAATWQFLQEHAREGEIDFGIEALASCVDDAAIQRYGLVPRAAQTPVLLPSQLDTWVQTSPPPATEPDIGLWLHGVRRASADVQIVWRSELDGVELHADPEALERSVRLLQARRPSALEAVSVPLIAARRWLAGDSPAPIADVTTAAESEDELPAAQNGRAEAWALCWRGDDSRVVKAAEVAPGDILVVPCSLGGVSAGNFDPESSEWVTDMGDLAQLRARGVASLRLEPAALKVWGLDAATMQALPRLEDEESVGQTRQRIADWIDGWPHSPTTHDCTEAEWTALRSALRASGARVATLGSGDAKEDRVVLLVTNKVQKRQLRAEITDLVTEDDDSSFRQGEVTLASHSRDVQAEVEKYANALGLASSVKRALSLAGWFHDVGKADARFQRWLVGGSEIRATLLAEPLAKSALPMGSRAEREQARQRAGYPAGYRHELLSLAMLDGATALPDDVDRDLVLHLVAAHHGFCRPFAPPLDHPEDVEVQLEHGGTVLRAGTRHRLSRFDSGVPERFWMLVRRYGWWGLAWLEAILRLADHRASEASTEATP